MKSIRESFRLFGYYFIIALLLYVFSYIVLSRTSMYVGYYFYDQERNEFYYLPVPGTTIAKCFFLDCIQRTLTVFYQPLAFIDCYFTGARRQGIPSVDMRACNSTFKAMALAALSHLLPRKECNVCARDTNITNPCHRKVCCAVVEYLRG